MENKKDFPIQKTWLIYMKQSWKSKKYKRKDLMSIIHYKNSFFQIREPTRPLANSTAGQKTL